MQRSRGAALLAGFVIAVGLIAGWCSACSDNGGGKALGLFGPGHRVCSLLSELDATGTAVARADIADPAAFDAALSTSVERYTKVLGELQSIAPPAISATVARLRSEVQQHQFAQARADHAALTAYAAKTCT